MTDPCPECGVEDHVKPFLYYAHNILVRETAKWVPSKDELLQVGVNIEAALHNLNVPEKPIHVPDPLVQMMEAMRS
jgi:hypothetical protein